jgi:hypothetical protein
MIVSSSLTVTYSPMASATPEGRHGRRRCAGGSTASSTGRQATSTPLTMQMGSSLFTAVVRGVVSGAVS